MRLKIQHLTQLSSQQDIVKQGVLEVCDKPLYDLDRNKQPRKNAPLDGRMGTARKNVACETCGETFETCNGHFGYMWLALPCFHVGFFKTIVTILQQICKECSYVLLSETDRRAFFKSLCGQNVDDLRRVQIGKKVHEQCKKTKKCPACGAVNGVVKKAGSAALKVIHDKFRTYNTSSSQKKVPPKSKVMFDNSFESARATNPEVEKHWKKAVDDLNPLRVLKLFQAITDADCEFLGVNSERGRPETFIWQFVPAPPVSIRPSVTQDLASTEDDITQKMADIVGMNNLIKQGLRNGSPTAQIVEQWDHLQLQVAQFVNSDVNSPNSNSKPIRGFCQRLKGKQGRFRGNLSGKRVDFSGRTVISPDPNLGIDQVAIPQLVAKTMTYPERVHANNIKKLRGLVENGPKQYPGAVYIVKPAGKNYLKYGDLAGHARRLQIGDTVERHLEDGDIVLFNRQPSLHRLSIMSHFVKVRPHRTFRLNECVCTPYNADFDGDEMNLHVPQTEEARTEARELMGVKHNLITPKNGEPIIAAIQDFITASYLLSKKDVFYNRQTFTNICMAMFDANVHIDLPPPTIVKPETLWTGKQVFNVLMRPNRQSPVLVNLDAACREYRAVAGQHHDLDKNDGWLCIRNSEIMCGVMDKSTIGSGKKDSVFYVILRDFGPDAAVQAMNRLAKLAARWLSEQGFSIGVGDVIPGGRLLEQKSKLIEEAYTQCDELIMQFKKGKLAKAAGCDEEQTLENSISGILSKVRQQAGETCISELSRHNAPLLMATSGSKGSNINVSQMVAAVGQQIIGGKRVEDGFQDRSLPHFPKNARQPPSKGFVRNSFFSGLSPSEFIFHAMSGREGLVDTAVKTAETGYMSRRLMKSLEDLSVQYDNTVRNSSSSVVQFKFGDDQLDPADMEGKAKPVNFERTFNHCEAMTWDNEERSLLPREIIVACEEILAPWRAKLNRVSLMGESLSYRDDSPNGIDQHESTRNFLDTVEDFLHTKALSQANMRGKLGLPRGLDVKDSPRKGGPRSKPAQAEQVLEKLFKLSRSTLSAFVETCLRKYQRSEVEPGHAVGAIGAQSIGEPGTQMTLKTFHFAGVAGMSVTEGVPRIKEIINASKDISTPIVTCELESNELVAARIVKGRIEKTYLKDIIEWIEPNHAPNDTFIDLKVDPETVQKLQLDITMTDISRAIIGHKRLKLVLDDIKVANNYMRVYVQQSVPFAASTKKSSKSRAASTKIVTAIAARLDFLTRTLPQVVVCGYPHATRAVITAVDDPADADAKRHRVMVEGYGLRACLATPGVDARRTRTNSVVETREVLGIEAARAAVAHELGLVLRDMDVDPRHTQLLADVMTYRGEVLGITRFGLSKMRNGVLQLASFERTPDHLFDAAWRAKTDHVEGVSECIIMGRPMGLGTGAFGLVSGLYFREGELGRKETVFADTLAQLRKARRD